MPRSKHDSKLEALRDSRDDLQIRLHLSERSHRQEHGFQISHGLPGEAASLRVQLAQAERAIEAHKHAGER